MDFIESVPHGKEHFLNETSPKETSEEVEIQTPRLRQLDDIYSCLSLIMLLSLFFIVSFYIFAFVILCICSC